MTATNTHEAIAERELEEFHSSYFLYADVQRIRRGEYVAVARRIQARGERRYWLSLAGCALMLLVPAMHVADYVHDHDLMELVQAAWIAWIAVSVAMSGASIRARTLQLRRFIEALFPEQVAALDEPVGATVRSA